MLPSLIIVFLLTTFTCGENPAIRVTLTNKGLQYGKHVGAGWVQDSLENMTIPVISGGISIGVLGTVHYTLKGVTVKQCDFPEPSVEFYKDEAGFKASISGLSIAVTAEWMMHCGLIHGGGSFKVAVFDVDATSIVELGEDADGHLSISGVSCNAGVGDVLIDFLGGASWIVTFLAKHLHGRIRGEIEKKICQAVQHATVDLEHRLQAMNVSFQVDQDLAVNVSLTSLPLVDASSLSLGLKGLFYSMKRRQSPPFEARPFTLPEQPGYMLSVGLSEFTANSASYGYYSVGLLQALINDSMIPPGCPLHLNTTSMGPFIPQLPELFPDLLMVLQVYARETPMFSFQPGAVKLVLLGSIRAFAIQPNATMTPLFRLNVDSNYSGEMWISSGRVKGSVSMDNVTVTLAASDVGPVKTAALGNVVQMGMKTVVSKLNGILAKGFVLPKMLVNTVLKVEKGFVSVSSDADVWTTDRGFK